MLSLAPGLATAATVVAVDGGDSVRVREGGSVRTIRLACLDAPELAQTPHGPAAQVALRQLLPVGSVVILQPTPRAGASTAVAELLTPTGSNINVQMVRTGQAFPTLANQPQCDPLRYAEAENTARFQRRGVWQVDGGIQRPWQWQAAKREQDQERQRQRALPLPAPRPVPVSANRIGTRRLTPQAGGYQLCLTTMDQQYRQTFGSSPAPKGLFQRFCSCLTTPVTTNETAMDTAARCGEELKARLSGGGL